MKTLIVVLLLSVSAFADSSCTTLYHHGQHDIVLCRVSDGQNTVFTKTELSNSGAEELTISEKLYRLLMEQDIAEEKAHTAQTYFTATGIPPQVTRLGRIDGDCTKAAQKLLYVETRLGVPKGHKVFIACDEDSYRRAAAQHGTSFMNSPYGFTDKAEVTTYLLASQVLRSDNSTVVHGASVVTPSDFGEFLIAHEIGHLVSGSSEYEADTWAKSALSARLPMHFNVFYAILMHTGGSH